MGKFLAEKSELAQAINQISRLKGFFKLRSGVISDTYFDKYLFESDPGLLRVICEEMAKLVPAGTEVLAGLELGGIPVVTVLSQLTGIPAAFIRKKAKPYGTAKYAEGAELTGRNVVIIEDVVSSGGAIIDALQKLNGDGVYPTTIICVIDRQTGGAENLRALGYELLSVLKMEDMA